MGTEDKVGSLADLRDRIKAVTEQGEDILGRGEELEKCKAATYKILEETLRERIISIGEQVKNLIHEADILSNLYESCVKDDLPSFRDEHLEIPFSSNRNALKEETDE